MGTATSPQYVENSKRRMRFSPLWFKITFFSLIKRWRVARLKLRPLSIHPNTSPCSISTNMDVQGAHFREHGWAFVDMIFEPAFHEEIMKNWPEKYHLEPPVKFDKSYNLGFQWLYGNPPTFHHSDPRGEYPTMEVLLNFLRSEDFCKRIRQFCGSDTEMTCCTFVLNTSEAGSEVIPHKDGIFLSKAKNFLNIIFFIDASGGPNSGGLMIARDNELKDVIFDPPRLRNTALIFNSMADVYHGFPPIAKGKFRKVITSQFCEKEYAETEFVRK